MNRKSYLVHIGRLLQKIPLSFLRVLEFPLIFLSNSSRKSCNMIVILAVPRSGSTLTYQTLIHGLSPVYLSNLSNLLYQLPLLGGYISQVFCSNHVSNFQSTQGFVDGVCGPGEGLRYWSYWMNSGIKESYSSDRSNKSRKKIVKRKYYIKKVLSILSKPHQPIITCYLGHTLIIKELQKLFPEAVFIRLNRSLVDNALSLLYCEKDYDKNWFSVLPKECLQYIDADKYKKVAAQVYWLNRRLNDDADIEQTIQMNYEDLCSDPAAELKKIIAFCNSKNMSLHQTKSLPNSFVYKKNTDKYRTDVIKIISAFEELENQFGRLSNSHSKN